MPKRRDLSRLVSLGHYCPSDAVLVLQMLAHSVKVMGQHCSEGILSPEEALPALRLADDIIDGITRQLDALKWPDGIPLANPTKFHSLFPRPRSRSAS